MVRRVYWVERIAPELEAARQIAATDPPAGLMKAGGPELSRFISARNRSRERVTELEALLYPDDDDD